MVKVPPLPVPELGSCTSSGRAWWLSSGRLGTPRESPGHWVPSHCRRCSSKPPPGVDSTASEHPGMAADEDFLQPIELLLPHAFHPTDGQESVVMLGAKAGSTEWLPLPIGSVKDIGGPDEEGIAHLKGASP